MKSNSASQLPLLVIVGETASGKSSLAFELAQRLDAEIICADSKTIYQEMDIGTAKPTKSERQKVKHWCLDLVGPDQNFNVVLFQQEAKKAIADIRERQKLPILVGGSGLYINSIVYDYDFRPTGEKSERSYLDNKSVNELIQICRANNYMLPKNQHNKRHLIRAIESKGNVVKNTNIQKNVVMIGIKNQKAELENRIRSRIRQMLEQGLIRETIDLYNNYDANTEAFTADIYPLVRRYLDGEINIQQLIDLAVIKDRQLAKKQRTWFGRDKNIKWFDLQEAREYILSVFK